MSDNQREAGTIILDPTHASFAPEETVHDLGATHFIGIGGAGMSAVSYTHLTLPTTPYV